MELKKERNFINAYEGTTKLGSWNISTGQFIGKSGKPVKTVPSCFTYDKLQWFGMSLLGGAIRMYREYWSNPYRTWCGSYTTDRANRMEQLLSLGLYPNRHTDLDSTVPLTKDLVEWLKNSFDGEYTDARATQFVITKKYRSQLPENYPSWVNTVMVSLEQNSIPTSFSIPALRRAINEHWEYMVSDFRVESYIGELISDYYKYSMTMWGKVNVEPNMPTKICTIRFLYKEYSDKHYNEVLKAFNDKPWLYFENDTLIARPLVSKTEFHEEAQSQHNCVERIYMERVHSGLTHIVTIRYKHLPEQTYITCEVDNNGHIIQYLTACNNIVTDRGGIQFREQYSDHLLSSLNE